MFTEKPNTSEEELEELDQEAKNIHGVSNKINTFFGSITRARIIVILRKYGDLNKLTIQELLESMGKKKISYKHTLWSLDKLKDAGIFFRI